MFRTACLTALLVLCAAAASADFDDRFLDETLRIDYHHTGAADEEIVSLDRVYRQGIWAGSRVHLIDTLDLGRYYAKLYDAESGELVWSRGFDSYFGEWATTGPAAAGIRRTYHESVLAPFPKAPVEFALEVRRDGELSEVFRQRIDPAHYETRRDPVDEDIVVVEAWIGGDPHGCVDVVILGEGYTTADRAKFAKDVKHFAEALLDQEPFASLRENFNVRGVLKPSQERGCDEPSRGIHVNTSLGCTFDSLGSTRYMLTEDNRAIRDVAAAAPYDVLSIMVNSERYGGGGIYNLFNTFTSDNQWSDYVFVHEFGHGFSGLADEYYSSSTAYNDFYPRGVEPRERNITALLPDGRPKWQHLLDEDVAVPSEWPKARYDAEDGAYQQRRGELNARIARLMTAGAPEAEVEAAKAESEKLSWDHQKEVDAWFETTGLLGKPGVYEGAGYCSEGMYRSELDCIMFTKGLKAFCAACSGGIREVVERYSE